MRAVFLLLLVELASLSIARAQDSFFEAGYIVQHADTTRGWIERTDEISLSQAITFKASPEAAAKTFHPAEITGFGFTKDGLQFETVQVEIRNGVKVYQTNRLAKKLLSGFTSLYKLQLPPTDRLNIFLTNNTFVYILQKEKKFYTLGQYEFRQENYVGVQKQYIGMLIALLSDCPENLKDIEKLQFKDKPVLERIRLYNLCKAPESTIVQHKYEVASKLKHGPEISYSKLFNFGTPNENTIASPVDASKIISSNGFAVGYFLDLLKPDLSRSTSLLTGINYLYLEHSIMYKSWQGTEVPLYFTTHSIRIPVIFQYNFNKKTDAKNYPFLCGGFTNRFLTNAEFKGMGFAPYLDLGAGLYTGRFRSAVLLESSGIGFRTAKIINFSLAYDLSK